MLTMILRPHQLLLIVLLILPASCVGQEPVSLCGMARKSMVQAVAIRGLSAKGDVPCKVASRPEIELFLRATVQKQLPPQRAELEAEIFKAVGLIPEDFEYVEGIVRVYLGQIGGYYDPELKHFVMASWIPEPLQRSISVHELTHALQDQHFNLEKILDPNAYTTDTAMAHSALVEGDATAVMTDYESSRTGGQPLRQEANIDVILAQNVISGALSGEDGTPETLQAILMFPYTSGLRFVHYLLRRGGYATVDEAFRRLPSTTREILHPEIYVAGTLKSLTIDASETDTLVGAHGAVYSDSIGEFAISTMLCSKTLKRGECAEASKGWYGDRIAYYRLSESERTIVWDTRWESREDALQFASAYKEFLRIRHGRDFGEERSVLDPARSLQIHVEDRRVVVRWWIKST